MGISQPAETTSFFAVSAHPLCQFEKSGLNVGSGLQVDFQQAFLRVEYEYLSRVETHRVIDIRHTPLSLSAGVKF